MSHDLVDALRAEIAKGHVLVVVGAGVSIEATEGNPLASWQGLLENGVERCVAVRGLDAKWANRVREEIRSGDLDDLLSVAEKISSKLGFPTGGEYRRWLHETVGTLELKDRNVVEAIRDLGLPIATTNYDNLLEEATGRPAVTWRGGDKAARVIRGEEFGILHLHGHWEEPESVILGIRSYEHIRGNPYAQAVLRAIQTLHTLLFIGCGDGLDDPNFGALLAWAREAFRSAEARHYRLCRENEFDNLREKHREERLFPISYGPKHEDLGPFVRCLGTGTKKDDKSKPAARPSRLPGRPSRCFGREDEVRELVETLLQPSPLSTPILGPPGVGKTTITLEALNEPRVQARYGDRRFFIRCDGARSRDALVAEIALGIGLESRPDLEHRLFQDLERAPGVLALDNLETPWEADTTAVEDLLTQLSTIQGIILVASVRGDQRPFGPRWREAIRVGPFGLYAARDAFVDVAGTRFRSDPDLDRLLEAVDRLPIAVVLMAHQAEGEPDLALLWKRWQEQRTALLRRADGKERLTNIEVSLELSIECHRMTQEARRLLSVLALLPDGAVRQDLELLLPEHGDESASILRKVGLAFDQGARFRILAPVREYVRRQRPPHEVDLDRALAHFLALATSGERLGCKDGAEVASRLVGELGNLDGMILKGLGSKDLEPAIRAALGFGKFLSFTGWGVDSVVQSALTAALTAGRPDLEADCLRYLGHIALNRSDHETACTRYQEALALYRQVGGVQGEANCIHCLGDIAIRRSDCNTARARYEEALPLYRSIGFVQGEADCIQRLGEIAFRRSDCNTARTRYEEALPLYRFVGDILGEANCIQSLGDIALRFSDRDVARARYEEALPLYRNVGDVLGEANCIQGLGDIAIRRSDCDEARARYEQALPLYRNVGDVLGEANCIQGLGDIARRLSNLDTAAARFHQALELYRRIRDPYSIGGAHVRLARITEASDERQSHLRAAREAWESIQRPDLVERLQKEFGESS